MKWLESKNNDYSFQSQKKKKCNNERCKLHTTKRIKANIYNNNNKKNKIFLFIYLFYLKKKKIVYN